MPKDTYYFSHDYNARNDEKILELRVKYGAEGYGLFWMLVETMAENDNGGAKASLIGGLSLGYGVDKGKLLEFIRYCIDIELFYEDEGFIFSRRMKKHKEFREKLSTKGKEGADKRWSNNAPPNSPPIGEGNAKERKGKEIKGNESTDVPSQNLANSNLHRQPTIPTKNEVWEVFSRGGGTKEMAKSFYDKHEGTGWFINGSPITNFTSLAGKFIDNWKRNENKNGHSSTVDNTKVKIVRN
jgi:hypothetical protein